MATEEEAKSMCVCVCARALLTVLFVYTFIHACNNKNNNNKNYCSNSSSNDPLPASLQSGPVESVFLLFATFCVHHTVHCCSCSRLLLHVKWFKLLMGFLLPFFVPLRRHTCCQRRTVVLNVAEMPEMIALLYEYSIISIIQAKFIWFRFHLDTYDI